MTTFLIIILYICTIFISRFLNKIVNDINKEYFINTIFWFIPLFNILTYSVIYYHEYSKFLKTHIHKKDIN